MNPHTRQIFHRNIQPHRVPIGSQQQILRPLPGSRYGAGIDRSLINAHRMASGPGKATPAPRSKGRWPGSGGAAFKNASTSKQTNKALSGTYVCGTHEPMTLYSAVYTYTCLPENELASKRAPTPTFEKEKKNRRQTAAACTREQYPHNEY